MATDKKQEDGSSIDKKKQRKKKGLHTRVNGTMPYLTAYLKKLQLPSTVVNVIQTSLSGLWHMITGAISSCNLQGPIGIAETSGAAASQGLDSFFWFVAVLSTAVGLLNLFPIPVLDGGHLLFHAYEAVAGRPPSDKALRVFMTVGLTLILSLMLFALTNDLFCP